MEEIIELTKVRDLLENKQYTTLRQTLSEMNEADIAAVFEDLEDAEQLKLFRILPKDMAADVFSYLDPENQHYIT